MYEERKTFDVLKGTVPDFSGADITLAFTVDKEKVSGSFPNRNSGYLVQEVQCENEVTAEWNNYEWNLEHIKNPKNATKIKCNIDFTKLYTEDILHGAYPVFDENEELVPVEIEENGVVTKANLYNEWYSYAEKKWANAVILNATGKAQTIEPGNQIKEEWIESYFVWIPKYSYKLFDQNLGNYTEVTQIESKDNLAIEIKFGLDNTTDNGTIDGEPTCKTPMLDNKVQGASGSDGNCAYGNYMTHSAFLAFDTSGIWVGKFETSNNNGIQVKPNVISWRSITVGNSFKNSRSYQPDLQSHLMKNTEWGAVAYLTQSIYGRCDKETGTCKEVEINSNSSYYTGYTGNTAYGGLDNAQSASTTGNYSGIYDMSGGAQEQMASVMLDIQNKNPLYYSSNGWSVTDFDDRRYYDVYSYYANQTHWDRRILGDATGEIGPFTTSSSDYIGSMWSDYANFINPTASWFHRGAHYFSQMNAGVFSYTGGSDGVGSGNGFRIVLAVS